MAQLTITQNDKLYIIGFTVKDVDGIIVDLTNITNIKFQVATQNDYTNLLNGTCVVTDAVNGKCKYFVQAIDFPIARRYYGMLQLTFNTGKILSTKAFVVIVEPECG